VTLARASQVSKRWRELLNDELTWKLLCDKHAYRRMSNDTPDDTGYSPSLPPVAGGPYSYTPKSPKSENESTVPCLPSASAPNLTTSALSSNPKGSGVKRRPKSISYRSHFKQKFMVEAAWRKGGGCIIKHITPDPGVVTSLHLTDKYIIVALDNAKIHIFNTIGDHQRTLQGHVMGVWAMVPWNDMLVSGGCDREVRVWNMANGLVKLASHLAGVLVPDNLQITDKTAGRVFISYEVILLPYDV
jgi:F-box and WD-40 domain protein CDC4